MSRDSDGAHEILKWRTVSGHILQIAGFFSRFIEDRTTIYPKFFNKCSPELCRVSTAQFMTAVHGCKKQSARRQVSKQVP